MESTETHHHVDTPTGTRILNSIVAVVHPLNVLNGVAVDGIKFLPVALWLT